MKAIRENSVWTIQWYPDTPVGFACVGASTFEAAARFALARNNEGSERSMDQKQPEKVCTNYQGWQKKRYPDGGASPERPIRMVAMLGLVWVLVVVVAFGMWLMIR